MMKATHPPQTQVIKARLARQASGQAMVEYIIIGSLVILALVAILSTVAPVIAGIFDNTIGAFDPDSTPVDPAQRDTVLTLVASYTPGTGSITTPPAPGTVNHPPSANNDAASTDQNVAVNVFVLNNDFDPDGDSLTIVAVDSPTGEGGTATLNDNGTPANPSDDFISYTPPANFIGVDTFTYTVNDGQGGSDSAAVLVEILDPFRVEPTPAPSPTPFDVVHDAPYYDGIRNPDWWRQNQGDVFLGYEDWQVSWFTWDGATVADVDAAMNGIPACTTTQPYSEDINFFWNSGGPTPGGACPGDPWRTDYFAARWMRTFGVAEDVTVELTTIANEGIEVFIDDVRVDAISAWDLVSATQYRSTEYTFTGGVEHTIIVKFFEHTMTAAVSFLIQDGSNPDLGQCAWTISAEQTHSDPYALSDSPGREYANNSLCYVALRGAVKLATLTDVPRMTFWESYSLNTYDSAWLQIREYGAGGPWYQQLLHRGQIAELAWTRREIDLTAFGSYNADTGQPATIDWTGKTIEFRFLLESDNSNTADGWWIDDVNVDADVVKIYTVGFEDDMESGNEDWLPGGSWLVSSEKVRSGRAAWSDSPNLSYPANVSATLQLDGVVNLTDPASIDPELVFYHAWDLGEGDSLFVEVSSDGVDWTSLTPNRPGGALVTGSTNLAFVREAISLHSTENPYQDSVFFLRFRLQSDASSEGNGWWIDDLVLQNRDNTALPYPFFDDMENGGDNWLADDGWAIAPEAAYRGGAGWTDSPVANYNPQTEVSLRTTAVFDLSSGAATNPELSFWHRQDLGAGDSFSAEASTDDGASWQPLWMFAYDASTAAHPAAPGTPLYEFNQQLGWEYTSVNLSAYVGARFLLRFRLNALDDTGVGDGVWIDDVRLAEHVETPHSVPFVDNMEGSTNWRTGGTWALSNETSHSGVYAFSDSPAAFYTDQTWSVLELSQPVDLTTLSATDFPVLYWWDRFSLDQADYARVQITTWEGPTWSDWSPWQEVYQQYFTTTLSWDRRQVDLRSYAGQKIRIRFVLDALQNTLTGDGWWIDDVTIQPYAPTVVPFTSFMADATDLSGWSTDGSWGLDSIIPLWGTNAETLGTGVWDTTFYDLRQYTTKQDAFCGGSTDAERAANALSGIGFAGLGTNGQACDGPTTTFTPAATATGAQGIAEIAFNCGLGSSPNPNGTCSTTSWKADHDHMAIGFTRNFTVALGGYYEFSLVHDDGVRLFLDDPTHTSPYIDRWTDVGSVASHTVSLFLTTGPHTLEIWYYENASNATLQLESARPNFSFHDSPGPGVPYGHQFNAALTMDGSLLDLSGASNPTLSWYEMVDLANYDCIVAEVSLPYAAFDRWFEVYRLCGAAEAPGGTQTATIRGPIETALGLTPGTLNFDGVQLALRFRLDARLDSAVGDGWWIDNIAVIEPTP